MSNSLTIVNHDLTVKEYRGQRVVTFKDIDTVHERPQDTAHRNFKTNKKHFIEGTDYFYLTASQKDEIRPLEIPNRGITVITESGYLMLVKSFTDDLAWKVQRALVNTYFRVKEKAKALPDPDKQKRLEVYEKNVRNRAAQIYLNLAKTALTESYKNIMLSYAAKELSGEYIIPLPVQEQKTYSATDIAAKFGVTANLIGRLANLHNLKTDEYGRLYADKSPHSRKEVETFRYYDSVIPKFEELFSTGGIAQ